MVEKFFSSDEYLTHTGMHYKVIRDSSGDSVLSTARPIRCFAYVDRVILSGMGVVEQGVLTWNVMLESDVLVEVGDIIGRVSDQFGNPILDAGKVEEVQPYHHWDHGPLVQLVRLGAADCEVP